MRAWMITTMVALLLGSGAASAQEWKQTKRLSQRQKIDEVAAETLDRLFAESPKAKELYGKAHGYAVFDNLKVAFGLSGGAGNGVAVEGSSGDRTYMKMGTGGVGFGLGGQKFQVVLLFEDSRTFRNFVDEGWQADVSAHAAAGKAGANAASTFTNGMAIFQLTDKGLMASADITGTRYWKNDKLNKAK